MRTQESMDGLKVKPARRKLDAGWRLGLALALAWGALGSPSTVSAQAWTRDQGSFYTNLSYRTSSAGSLRDHNGESQSLGGTLNQHILGFYGEVGVIDRWLTLTLDGDLYRNASLQDETVDGFGDLRVSAFTGLLTAPFRLAAGVQLGLPTGSSAPTGASPIAAQLPTGDGEFDVAFKLAAGHSFGGDSYPLRHYLTGDVGFWIRTEGIHHGLPYRLEFGSQIAEAEWDRFWLIVRIVGLQSLGSSGPPQNAVGLGDGVTYHAPGLELYGRVVDGFGLAVSMDGGIYFENLFAAAVFKVTLSYQQ